MLYICNSCHLLKHKSLALKKIFSNLYQLAHWSKKKLGNNLGNILLLNSFLIELIQEVYKILSKGDKRTKRKNNGRKEKEEEEKKRRENNELWISKGY